MYPCWKNYESDLEAALSNYSQEAQYLVVSTTHSQCEKQFNSRSKQVWDAAERDIDATIIPCLHQLEASRHNPESELIEACKSGLRSRAASVVLNDRLRSTVDRWRSLHPGSNLAVSDAFSVTDGRCDMNVEGDALHFHMLLYDELAAAFRALGWRETEPSTTTPLRPFSTVKHIHAGGSGE